MDRVKHIIPFDNPITVLERELEERQLDDALEYDWHSEINKHIRYVLFGPNDSGIDIRNTLPEYIPVEIAEVIGDRVHDEIVFGLKRYLSLPVGERVLGYLYTQRHDLVVLLEIVDLEEFYLRMADERTTGLEIIAADVYDKDVGLML